MRKGSFLKKIVSCILVMSFFFMNSAFVFASNTTSKGNTTQQSGSGFDPGIYRPGSGGDLPVGVANGIFGALQVVAYFIAVGILLIYGIKWLLATANEKADLKKGFVNYVIGAIIVAGAGTIMNWVFGAVGM